MVDLSEVKYAEEPDLSADEFLALAQKVWPGEYARERVQEALRRTINVVARLEGQLVGSVRVLTDGYFFGTIPEVLVDPDYQRQGIGRALMQRAWERSPTSLFFGAQEGNEAFFQKLGYERSMVSFARKKERATDTAR